jgi:hypothetical protein
MADITPPVGLAAFAAAAISKEDPIATGFQGALYSLRTAILPFVFVFNPAMLLIGVSDWWVPTFDLVASLAAILLFAAASMNWFVTRARIWKSALLLLACFILFRPDWVLDQFYPRYVERPPTELSQRVLEAPVDSRVAIVTRGTNIEGETVTKTNSIPVENGATARDRLRAAGLTVTGTKITSVQFRSYAKRIGLEAGFDVVAILEPAPRPSNIWPILGAFLLTALVAALQWPRRRTAVRA